MKAKEFIIELKKESKPRNFVAKNASLAGKAGQHKDKKKAEKQGDVKHKKEIATMESVLSELSTEKLAQYKKAAGADATAADKAGDYKRGDKRMSGIIKATKKEFDNDKKKKDVAEATGNVKFDKMLKGITSKKEVAKQQKTDTKQQARDAFGNMFGGGNPADKLGIRKKGVSEAGMPFRGVGGAFNRGDDERHDLDPTEWYIVKDGKMYKTSVYPNQVQLAIAQGYSRSREEAKAKAGQQGVAERIRDPEDWDEGNTEPPNNFAVYINGKKWKVFKGRGRYADDQREQAHYQQLKDWAAKKSASTGKQWTVSITGETATESLDEVSWKGIKQGAAAAGLAGAMAFGAGSANARGTPGDDPSINRLTGKPIATQQATDNTSTKAEAPKGYNKEYLQKAADPNRTGRYMISVEKAQELLKQMDSKVGEGSMFAGAKVGHKEGPAGQWRNDGAKKNKAARPGDLVGGGM